MCGSPTRSAAAARRHAWRGRSAMTSGRDGSVVVGGEPRLAATSTSGPVRWSRWVTRQIAVLARSTWVSSMISSMTRPRSALSRATMRTTRSPAPVIEWISSTSGIGRQVGHHRRVALPLADLEGAEGGDRVAERAGIDRGGEALDHPALLEPVEPGLHRAAGHPERAGRTEHPDVRVVGEQRDEPCVEGVHPGLASHGHIVRVAPPLRQHRAQPDHPTGPPLHTVPGSRTVTG